MATMGRESGEGKRKVASLIDQVDKLRREMRESRMTAELILSRTRTLETEVAALIEKCSEPEASHPEEVEVIDLEEEEGNSGGTNECQRPPQRGANDELIQFKMGMRNDCGRIQGDVGNLLKLAQKLTSLGMGSGSRANSKSTNQATAASLSSTSVGRTSSIMDGRRSPTSAAGLIKTEDPTGRAETGGMSPPSLDSTGDAGFTTGLEGMCEGRTSTTTDSLDITNGGGQISTGALKKGVRRRKNSAFAVVRRGTEESSIHAETTDPNNHGPVNEAYGSPEKKRRRRISSKTDMGVPTPREKRTSRTTRSEGESSPVQELLSTTGCIPQKQTGVDGDPFANLEIEFQSQSVSPIGTASSSSTSPHVEAPCHLEPLTSHQSTKVFGSFECVFCQKTFKFKRVFEEHTLSHIHERPHFCNLCPYESSHNVDLNRHLETHKYPPERKQFKCEICQKLFSTTGNRSKHIRIVHEKKRPFKCEECPKVFPSTLRLKSHMLVHTGEKNHCCPICDKKFSHKHHLDDHIRLHTGEGPKCRFCGKSFETSHGHRHHERMHHALLHPTITIADKM